MMAQENIAQILQAKESGVRKYIPILVDWNFSGYLVWLNLESVMLQMIGRLSECEILRGPELHMAESFCYTL